jgi:azurin
MIIPIIKAKIKNNQLAFDDKRQFDWHLQAIGEDTEVDVVIKKHRNKRSAEQNRYYFGVVLKMISDMTGHSAYDLHCHFKHHLLRKKDTRLTAHKSTTGLDTKEFSDYIESIKLFAKARLNLRIPSPDEVDLDSIMDVYGVE